MYFEILDLIRWLLFVTVLSLVLVEYGSRGLGPRFLMTWHTLLLIAVQPGDGYDLDLKSQGEGWVVYVSRVLSQG